MVSEARADVDYCPPSRPKVKNNEWSYTLAPHMYLHCVHWEIFNFVLFTCIRHCLKLDSWFLFGIRHHTFLGISGKI
jgi:hypothetical protein